MEFDKLLQNIYPLFLEVFLHLFLIDLICQLIVEQYNYNFKNIFKILKFAAPINYFIKILSFNYYLIFYFIFHF